MKHEVIMAMMQPPRPIVSQEQGRAFDTLLQTAYDIARFKMQEPLEHYQRLKKILAFLFYFHRHNLALNLLATNPAQLTMRDHLRDEIVHTTQKIGLTDKIVLQTQAIMKQFMPDEISRVAKKLGLLRNAEVRKLEDLCDVIKNRLNVCLTIQDTELFALFSYNQKITLDSKYEHWLVPDKTFATWLTHSVIPFINRLSDEDSDESRNALRMLMIMTGEYCGFERAKHFAGDLAHFISVCAELRNIHAHELSNVNKLEGKLIELARRINPVKADDRMMDRVLYQPGLGGNSKVAIESVAAATEDARLKPTPFGRGFG